jgi:predicted amino acid racemase
MPETPNLTRNGCYEMYIKHIKPYIKPIYRMKSIQIGGLWRFMALGKHRKIGISMQVVQCLGGNRSDVE